MEDIKTYTYMCICISEYAHFVRKTQADFMGKKTLTSVQDKALWRKSI